MLNIEELVVYILHTLNDKSHANAFLGMNVFEFVCDQLGAGQEEPAEAYINYGNWHNDVIAVHTALATLAEEIMATLSFHGAYVNGYLHYQFERWLGKDLVMRHMQVPYLNNRDTAEAVGLL